MKVGHTGAATSDDGPPLTKTQIAELRRRVNEFKDPTRYVLVSAFSRTFNLFYSPDDGVYTMSEIFPSALFKYRKDALAVARALESRAQRRHRRTNPLQVIAVKKTKKGVRVLESVLSPWEKSAKWKPALKRRRATAS